MSNDKRDENQSTRRHFSPEDKIKILRLHLLEKLPISEVCEKHQITPTQFYQWQKTFLRERGGRLCQGWCRPDQHAGGAKGGQAGGKAPA